MVTDDEIRELVEADEAGVGDLLDAYAPAEQVYFAATTQPATEEAYSTVTRAADSNSVVDSAK